ASSCRRFRSRPCACGRRSAARHDRALTPVRTMKTDAVRILPDGEPRGHPALKGDQDPALDYAQRCLEMGRFQECLQSARELITVLEGPGETERFGLSVLPYVGACGMAAWSLAELGDNAGALEFIDRGRRVAVAEDDPYSRIVMDVCHGYLLAYHGD